MAGFFSPPLLDDARLHVAWTVERQEILFHELVHVEQYRLRGIPRFSELYVRGFLVGVGYEGIPLERNAYLLDGRYEKDPTLHFSVADEVAEWNAQGGF